MDMGIKKQEGIKIRIDEDMKNQFKDICDMDDQSMSLRINKFIQSEIDNSQKSRYESDKGFYISILLRELGHDNISIVDSHRFELDDRETNGSTTYKVGTFNIPLVDIISNNKDKHIFLYLAGSDLDKNKIRAYLK